MADYRFEAVSAAGARQTGTLSAASERDAAGQLDARGLFPVKLEAVKPASRGWGGGRVADRHMATFYSQLADLLRSGVPLLRALDILERQAAQPSLAEVVRDVRAKVADGTSLAEAMGRYPQVFGELAVSMIRAGQEGGFLEDVLKRIADFTENQEDLKSRVVGALAYPVFLAVVGFVVLNVLVIFFVPRFQPIFAKLEEKGELPALTVGLMATSTFLQRHGWWVVILAGVGVYGLRKWAAGSGRLTVDRWRLAVPGAGRIYLNLALSRFTRILGTLLHNGIPILQSLRIAKDSTGNRVLSDAIERSADNVTAGDKLAAPLRACAYFPRDVVEMVAVAEESNSLETVLLEVANSLEKRTSRQLELFVRLLEPVMLLVMAGLTLVVVSGLLLPVFKISSAVK